MLQRDVAPVLGPLGIFSIVGMATRSSARSIGRDPRARPDNAFDAIELAIGAVTAEKFSDLSVTCEAAQGLNADRRRKQLISFWWLAHTSALVLTEAPAPSCPAGIFVVDSRHGGRHPLGVSGVDYTDIPGAIEVLKRAVQHQYDGFDPAVRLP